MSDVTKSNANAKVMICVVSVTNYFLQGVKKVMYYFLKSNMDYMIILVMTSTMMYTKK